MSYQTRQMYKQSHFTLPLFSDIHYMPFKKYSPSQYEDNLQQINLQNYALPLDNYQQNPQTQSIPKPTYSLTYNDEFEIIIGGENMYPLFIQVNPENLIVCSQESFLIIKIDESNPKSTSKTNSFLSSDIKLSTYHKVMLEEPPNCLKATLNHVYFGMKDGKILCYDLLRKNLTGISDHFQLPVMEIQAVSQNQILAIDSSGNIKYLQFSHKTFMDKIIKTLIHTRDIYVAYKVNKRQKIRKLFNSVVAKKQEILQFTTAQKDTANVSINVKDSQNIVGESAFYAHNRISVPGQHLNQILNKNYKILAVVQNNKLLILTCDNQYKLIQQQVIFQCPQNEEIKMLQFGVGGFENSNNTHLLIVFSLKSKLKYFKGIFAQDFYQWLFISQTDFQENILDGKFISNNLILVITEKNISLINATESPQKIQSFKFEKFQYIQFFIKEEGLNFDSQLIIKSILKTVNKKNEFFCLQGKRLLTGKIDSWHDYLQRYVDEFKFNEAMLLSLKIYNRELKKLANINQKQQVRNKQMKQFFEKIALTYVSYQIKKQNSSKEQMLKICVFFLIKTQCFHHLFTIIFQIFKSIGLQELFFQTIDSYVTKRLIKFMTEEIIDLMVKWYKNKNQNQKLQLMIQSFDLSLMEKSLLLIICLKQHLYQSMIYICIQHGDFISPILKLCGIYFTQELKESEKIRIKEILFFYLKECLLGHNTEFGNNQAYIEMLIQMINFIFIPNTLDMLVGISSKDTIKIINMFFETKIMQYILENEEKFFIKKTEEVSMNEFKTYQKMLSTLILIKDQYQNKKVTETPSLNQKQIQFQDFSFQVNTFLSYLILKNQFPFEKKQKLEAIFFFIEKFSFQMSLFKRKQVFNQDQKCINGTNQDQGLQKQEDEIQLNAYLMRLMDSLMRSLDGSQQQKTKSLKIILNKIQASDKQSILLQSKCYILHQLGRYGEFLATYLKMNNKKLKLRLFEYLQFNLNQHSDLIIEFINSLDIFLTLSQQKTMSLLYQIDTKYFDIQMVIQHLKASPQLQIQYIQKIIKNQPLPESKKNKLSLVHLQIVVKNNPSKLNYYIQKMNYPLQEAFKICEEKNNKTAKAYILIKSGRNIEGILLLCDLFLKTCDILFNQLARKKTISQSIELQLYDQLAKLLQSCHKQFQIDTQKGQKIWSKCLKKIFSYLRISQNMRNQSIPISIKTILYHIVEKTLKKMFYQMSPDYFIQKFCKKFPQLPFSVFIIAFGEVFDKMEFYSKLQLLEFQLQQKDANKLILNIFRSALKSHSIRSYCKICNQKISQSEDKYWSILAFSCGCMFHKQCASKMNKSLIQDSKRSQNTYHVCMNEIENFIQMKGIRVQYLKRERVEQKQKKMNKLKDFDNYQKQESYFF